MIADHRAQLKDQTRIITDFTTSVADLKTTQPHHVTFEKMRNVQTITLVCAIATRLSSAGNMRASSRKRVQFRKRSVIGASDHPQ
jgi:hypothetical protein